MDKLRIIEIWLSMTYVILGYSILYMTGHTMMNVDDLWLRMFVLYVSATVITMMYILIEPIIHDTFLKMRE